VKQTKTKGFTITDLLCLFFIFVLLQLGFYILLNSDLREIKREIHHIKTTQRVLCQE
jgi:hypothetical protein